MYLHIGNGSTVKKEEVIGIFDLDTATISKISKKFISENQKRDSVSYFDRDLPRSFILVGGERSANKEAKIKLSRISPIGLKKRIEEIIIE